MARCTRPGYGPLPAEGLGFVGWIDDCSGTDPVCKLRLRKDKRVIAVFTSYPAPIEKTGVIISSTPDGDDDGGLQIGVSWPNPRFTDNVDGTVTDNLTGLIWMKDGSCDIGRISWLDAFTAIQDLNAGADLGCTEYFPVPGQSIQLRSSRRVPDACGLVTGAGHYPFAVRAVGNRQDQFRVPGQCLQQSSRRRVPDARGLVFRRGHNSRPVRTKSGGVPRRPR